VSDVCAAHGDRATVGADVDAQGSGLREDEAHFPLNARVADVLCTGIHDWVTFPSLQRILSHSCSLCSGCSFVPTYSVIFLLTCLPDDDHSSRPFRNSKESLKEHY